MENETPTFAQTDTPAKNNTEKAGCILSVFGVILWLIGIYFIYKGGFWLGGRWYHWVVSLFIVGIVEQIVSKIVGFIVKASLGVK